MKTPQKISSQQMAWITRPENTNRHYRELLFKIYKYDDREKQYVLTHKELMTNEIERIINILF